MKVNFKRTTVFLIATLSAFALAIIFFILVPTVQHIFQLKNNIKTTESFLEEQYQKTKKMRRSVSRLEAVQKQAAQFSTAYISKDNELTAITTFEELANKNKIKQEDIRVTYSEKINLKENPVGSPFYTFSLAYSGEFADEFNFLRDIEKLPFYIILDNLRFERRGTNEEKNIFMRFDAKIYAKEFASQKN